MHKRRNKHYALKTVELTRFWIGYSKDIVIFNLKILEVVETFICVSNRRQHETMVKPIQIAVRHPLLTGLCKTRAFCSPCSL